MLETIIIALIICKIKGYKIKGLFNTWEIYTVILIESIYIFLQVNIYFNNYFFIEYVGVLKSLYLCSYLPIIFKYKRYVQALIGSVFVFTGGILNDIAIKANSGYMPAFPTLSYLTGYVSKETFNEIDNLHRLGNSETNLKILTDIFDTGYSILSLGDIFIRVYVFIIIYSVIKEINVGNKETNVNDKEINKSVQEV